MKSSCVLNWLVGFWQFFGENSSRGLSVISRLGYLGKVLKKIIIIISFSVMSYSKKSIWDTFSCRSITKVRECLCVLKQVLIVNLYNINIQNMIIKGGFQTWSYIKGFSFLIAFLSITHVGFFLTCVITLQSVTVMHTSRETVHKATCKNSTHLWWWSKLYCT